MDHPIVSRNYYSSSIVLKDAIEKITGLLQSSVKTNPFGDISRPFPRPEQPVRPYLQFSQALAVAEQIPAVNHPGESHHARALESAPTHHLQVSRADELLDTRTRQGESLEVLQLRSPPHMAQSTAVSECPGPQPLHNLKIYLHQPVA
jgi:hypothetical protein